MTRRMLLGALLLSTAAIGAGVAVAIGSEHHRRDHDGVRFARDDHGRHGDDRRHGRHHDDDDDGEHGGRGPRPPQNGPTDPNAPVPDNGLFQGKTRPKVDVQ